MTFFGICFERGLVFFGKLVAVFQVNTHNKIAHRTLIKFGQLLYIRLFVKFKINSRKHCRTQNVEYKIIAFVKFLYLI